MASRPPTSTNSTGSQGSPPPPNNKQVQQETPSANDAQPQSRHEGLTAAEVNTGMRLPAFTDAFIKGGLSGRPAIANYAAPDCRIIHAAAKAFEARVIAVKAFPVQRRSLYGQTSVGAKLIKSKTSHVRFEVLDIARAIVPPVYGFKADGKKASLKHNERLYDFIKTKFAFKDPKLSQGFMEHEVFVLLFRGWAFAKEHKPGALYEPLFNPVSIYTLAFLKLIVKYVLDEWSTGRYVQGPGLKAKTYSSQYERHLQDVADWAETVPTVTRTIRAKMFRSAREPFVTADSEPTGLDAAAVASITAELSRRTGDTDDEAADDDDDSMSDQDDHSGFGAQTAGVHGKGLEGTGTDLEGGHAIDDNGSGIVTDDSRNGGDNGNDNNDGNGNNDGGNGGGDDDGMVGDDSGNGDDDEDKIEVGEGVGEGEGIGECVITHWLRCTDTEGRTRHWPQCIDEDGVLKRLPRARDEAGKKCILDGQFIYVAMDADGNEFYVNEDGRKVLEW
ncbi:hypothetical protein BDZ89DRAFT_1156704 [Hymenopellis radicata]|nr:hypothetical protein BDZ89DRAFT_1156704 [Hymenopellis radicata]